MFAGEEEFNDQLADHLGERDFNSFWKAWRKKFCSENLKPSSRLNRG